MATFYPSTWATYNSFLNAYGVWPNPDLESPGGEWVSIQYNISIPVTDSYTLRCSGDNHVRVNINGGLIGTNDDWSYYNDFSVTLTPGPITIDVLGLNDGAPQWGNPGSVAAALYTSDGTMVWNTRENASRALAIPTVETTTPRTHGMYVKRSGVWTEVINPTVHHDGTWKSTQKGFVKQNGVWKQFFPDSGTTAFNSPGTYTWKVPPGVHQITVDMTGGGGGGGGSSEVGSGGGGGGGGSGGYYKDSVMAVTPGEMLTIHVGPGGSGAPYVGRTSSAPGGAQGGASSINGSKGSLVATGGAGGGGGTGDGGGGGGKIICTKLHEFGYLPDYIYEADERFGEYLRANDPYAYYGYIKWASVVVDWMERDGPQCMFWIRDKEKRNRAQRNMAIAWARRIATPWAYHMAYLMGVEKEDNFAGKLIMKTGMFVSRIVGKFAKDTKPTNSRLVGYAMWGMFGLFWLLAGLDRKQQ